MLTLRQWILFAYLFLSQHFHFDILSEGSIYLTASFTTAILLSRRQRTMWQRGVRLRDVVD